MAAPANPVAEEKPARSGDPRGPGRALVCAALWATGAIALAIWGVSASGRLTLSELAGKPIYAQEVAPTDCSQAQSAPGDQSSSAASTQSSQAGQPGQAGQAGQPGQPGQPGQSSSSSSSSSFDLSQSVTQQIPGAASVTAAAPSSSGGSPSQVSFRLCGGADAQVASSLEQFIAGRSFSARLVSRPDGCADLSVDVAAVGGPATSRQSSMLSVTSGAPANSAGSGQRISVQIVSENGTTHVTVG